jgi:hypothetical protein
MKNQITMERYAELLEVEKRFKALKNKGSENKKVISVQNSQVQNKAVDKTHMNQALESYLTWCNEKMGEKLVLNSQGYTLEIEGYKVLACDVKNTATQEVKPLVYTKGRWTAVWKHKPIKSFIGQVQTAGNLLENTP